MNSAILPQVHESNFDLDGLEYLVQRLKDQRKFHLDQQAQCHAIIEDAANKWMLDADYADIHRLCAHEQDQAYAECVVSVAIDLIDCDGRPFQDVVTRFVARVRSIMTKIEPQLDDLSSLNDRQQNASVAQSGAIQFRNLIS